MSRSTTTATPMPPHRGRCREDVGRAGAGAARRHGQGRRHRRASLTPPPTSSARSRISCIRLASSDRCRGSTRSRRGPCAMCSRSTPSAPSLCVRECVRRMSTKHGGKGGSIVLLSSMAAPSAAPTESVWYAAAKGAIDSLTIGVSREVAKEGIRVNAISPGMIDTDIQPPGARRAAAVGAADGQGGQRRRGRRSHPVFAFGRRFLHQWR